MAAQCLRGMIAAIQSPPQPKVPAENKYVSSSAAASFAALDMINFCLEVASNLHLTHKRAYNLSELINRACKLSDSTPQTHDKLSAVRIVK